MKVSVNKEIKTILYPLIGGVFSVMLLLILTGASSDTYALSQYSQELIQRLVKNEEVEVKLYLKGDLTPEFQRLEESTLNVLNSFGKATQGKVKIQVVEPPATLDSIATPPISDSAGGKVYPYATVSTSDRIFIVPLLTTTSRYSLTENITASIDRLEYEFATAFKTLEQEEPKNIAFVEGHGELDQWQVLDAEEQLSKFYSIHRGGIIDNEDAIMTMDALVIAGPHLPFNTEEKYILDQYIMSGGSVLWLVDGAKYIESQLQEMGQTVAIKNELNIDDLLFAYGVRIEGNLVLDARCTNREKQPASVVPYPYAPILTPNSEHLINTRVKEVKTSFISSLSMVESSSQVEKTVLLRSSDYATLEILPHIIDPKNVFEYETSNITIAVALQGNFTSAFDSRPRPPSSILQKKNSGKGKMVVVASSSIIRNGGMYHKDIYQVLPMGWDRISNKTYDNRIFIENALNWLTNDDDYLRLITKSQIKTTLNTTAIIDGNTLYIALIGTSALLILISIVGSIVFYRRRKYRK